KMRSIEATSKEDHGWEPLTKVGNSLITKRHPDFNPRSYKYSKLSGLIAARSRLRRYSRSPAAVRGEGKSEVVYVRSKCRAHEHSI
ncbi:OST-HTH/LOTUS domain-containing protein, partial [Cladorrhinum samala]